MASKNTFNVFHVTLLSIGTALLLLGVVGFLVPKPSHGIRVRINWVFNLPPCSSTTHEDCALFINVVAFRHDGSMLTVATQLPPTATNVDTTLPTVGVYDFWVIASIRDADGKLEVLPGKEAVSVTDAGADTVTPELEQPDSDSTSLKI